MNPASPGNQPWPKHRPSGSRRAAGWIAWLIALGLLFMPGLGGFLACGQSVSEYKVKSTFLFHFAQFIDWPPRPAGAEKKPLVIGVFDDGSMDSVLEETLKGETVKQRPVQVKRCSSQADLEACDMVFISRSKADQASSLLRASAKKPILTVGEADGFMEAGGILNFYVQDNKIRFEANPSAADRAGLKISSRLLKLARIVQPPPPEEAK